jgi:hypothetical protein
MEKKGARAIDFNRVRLNPGDVMVYPFFGINLKRPPESAEIVAVLAFPSSIGLTPYSMDAMAGFYADSIGPLPFAVINQQKEGFGIYRFTKEFSFANSLPNTDRSHLSQ